jgi:CheY-like chemotaxis protein
MDGLEATRAIRQREQETGRRVPIIAMTAHVLKGDRERCLEAGMDSYVPKPINPEELAREMGAVVSQRVPQSTIIVAADAADGIIDQARIDGLRDMDPNGDLLRELAGIFRDECPAIIEDVRGAIDRNDAGTANRKAHQLRGSLLSLGALRASAEAQMLESSAKQGRLDEAAGRLNGLTREIERFQAVLNSMCENTRA